MFKLALWFVGCSMVVYGQIVLETCPSYNDFFRFGNRAFPGYAVDSAFNIGSVKMSQFYISGPVASPFCHTAQDVTFPTGTAGCPNLITVRHEMRMERMTVFGPSNCNSGSSGGNCRLVMFELDAVNATITNTFCATNSNFEKIESMSFSTMNVGQNAKINRAIRYRPFTKQEDWKKIYGKTVQEHENALVMVREYCSSKSTKTGSKKDSHDKSDSDKDSDNDSDNDDNDSSDDSDFQSEFVSRVVGPELQQSRFANGLGDYVTTVYGSNNLAESRNTYWNTVLVRGQQIRN